MKMAISAWNGRPCTFYTFPKPSDTEHCLKYEILSMGIISTTYSEKLFECVNTPAMYQISVTLSIVSHPTIFPCDVLFRYQTVLEIFNRFNK